MLIQYIILAVVLTVSVVYAVYRAIKALSVKSGDPCYGCALKDACQKSKVRHQHHLRHSCKDKVTSAS